MRRRRVRRGHRFLSPTRCQSRLICRRSSVPFRLSPVPRRTVAVGAAHARGLLHRRRSQRRLGAVGDRRLHAAGPKGATLVNPYHAIYLGLASDRTDGDGQPLAASERNYSWSSTASRRRVSVLRRRFLEDARRECAASFDPEKLLAVDEVRSWGASTEAKELGKQAARGTRLEAAASPPAPRRWRRWRSRRSADREGRDGTPPRFLAERAAFGEAEKRLICEGMLDPARHKTGSYDTAMRTAMLAFQQKQTVMDQADIKRRTLEALARPPLENDLRLALRRVPHRARHARRRPASWRTAASPTTIVPGGALGGPTYLGADGARHRVPDLGDAVARRGGAAGAGDRDARGRRGLLRRHARADFA